MHWAIPEKIQIGDEGWLGLRFRNVQGYWRNSIWKFQQPIKKEMEFPEVIKKKSCGNPMDLVFWSRNFHRV